MNTLTKDNEDQSAFKREKGTRYPAITLERAIDAISAVSKNLGNGPYDRLSLAKALGYKSISGPAGSSLGALVHYGLIERTGSSAYEKSELTKRILAPIDDQEKQSGIKEALQRPKLYDELIRTYNSAALPQMLANILNRKFGISLNNAERAVKTFRDSCEYAGILKNGVLQPDPTPSTGTISDENLAKKTASQNATRQTQDRAQLSPAQTIIQLAKNVQLVVSDEELVSAFAFGEFAEELRKFKNKLNHWTPSSTAEDD